MNVHAYTSFSLSYLNRATVLANSLRRQHPDWTIWAVLTDREPEGFKFDREAAGFDRVFHVEELYGEDTESWLFTMDVVEACTAVKGRAARMIFDNSDADLVIYFDPDIAIFAPLSPVLDLLEEAAIVLTPHQTEPEPRSETRAILDNEITSLHFGVFNLGFLGLRRDDETLRFLDWWTERLEDWCYDRLDIGLFVDQKWCNLVPCFFDGVRVLRDPGCNVASWNLSRRQIRISLDGEILVGEVPLRFFHFTKLGPIGDIMTVRYAAENTEVYELWAWYRAEVERATDPAIPQGWWAFGKFSNGAQIPKQARMLYRERADLRRAFPDPRNAEGGFFAWLVAETSLVDTGQRGVSE